MIKQSQLNSMSRKQLESLKDRIQQRLDRTDEQKLKKAHAAAAKVAKRHGFSLDELLSVGASARKPAQKRRSDAGRKVPPKYRHPSDPSKLWTGRGRSPKWVLEAIDSGLSMEDLKINQ